MKVGHLHWSLLWNSPRIWIWSY